ncbi:unnamed protein product [Menidia menidia]|uniref:(Atlantic silverside) hypothetical protein n=1 Tax=Menidia menidia TaxID=238744 RepID=A0A8S4AWF6_9TELE|nr:unnamed protein product [Menidia menidia]
MSSDEDFSLVTDNQPSEDTLEGVRALIKDFKKRYGLLLEEQKELADGTADQREMARQFRQRAEKISQDLEEDRRLHGEQLTDGKMRLELLRQEEADLEKEIQKMKTAMKEEEVFSAMPERRFVFRGQTGDADAWKTFDMKPDVSYPMAGGTALVTFEEEEGERRAERVALGQKSDRVNQWLRAFSVRSSVASNILSMGTHTVELEGECRVQVEARPVQLMVPSLVEVDSEVCPHRVLVSSLPRMDTETLVNKLEIHFSKRKNGGGEVDACEFLPDSGTVETLQDILEIHFQKQDHGGGEIEAFFYNPPGGRALARFADLSAGLEEEE